MLKQLPLVIFCLALAALGAFAGQTWFEQSPPPEQLAAIDGATVLDQARKLPSIELINQHNETLDISAPYPKWQLYNFGFTRCPDVCPTELARLANAARAANDAGFAEQFQVSFVTLDPETDSPERLTQYLAYFDENTRGLTGKRAQLESLAAAMGIAHSRTESDESGAYNIDHGTAYVLVDPQQRIRAYMTPPHETETVAKTVVALLQKLVN